MSKLAELERQIEAERAAAAQADWEAGQAQARKAAEEQRRRAEGPLGKAVDRLEQEAGRALERAQQTAAETPLPPLDLRFLARRLLLGTSMPAPEEWEGPHVRINQQDPAAVAIWHVVDTAQRARREAEQQLGLAHAITARADKIECAAWSAYQQRMRELAGELSG